MDNFGTQETVDGIADYDDTYVFDLSGNRRFKLHGEAGTSNDDSTYFFYTDRDQLYETDSDLHGVIDNDFDANGSMIASGSDTYTWDLRNRMASATVGSTTTSFAYDYDGVRVSKKVGGGLTVTYLNDKQNPTGYAKAIEESDATNGLRRSYIVGLDVVGQVDAADGTLRLLMKDGHGSTRALLSALQAVLEVYNYDAYANLINFTPGPTGAPLTDWLAPDGRSDGSTGLNYNLARYLDPSTGQFVSYDSFEADPASPAMLHKYAFANSNPIIRADPSGNFSESEELTVAGGQSTLLSIMVRSILLVNRVRTGVAAAFAAGGTTLGAFFRQIGADAEEIATAVFRLNPEVEVEEAVAIENKVIDFSLQNGDKIADLEVKYRIPETYGPAFDRLVSQIDAMVSSGAGQPVVWSVREPTVAALFRLQEELGPAVFGRCNS